ncbi:MAG: hypothetical protein JXR40_00920 [Pontiellaceae bacterium]|nr:hypothetical protein [Pontiellaceae bacterium]
MRKPILYIVCCAGLFGGTAVRAEIRNVKTVTFKTGNEYDVSRQTNAVDKSAGFDAINSTGAGRNKDLVIGVNDFSGLFARAAANGFGGVVYFDGDVIQTEFGSTAFVAYMGRKTLRVTTTAPICTDFYVASTPISGPGKLGGEGFLARSLSDDGTPPESVNLKFTWKESGFAAGEHVRAVAGTILGMSFGDMPEDNWVMKVSLDNGDVIAATAPVNTKTGDGLDDTFFGVYAPEDRYIVGVSWINDHAPSLTNNVSCGLDDFAFITSNKSFVIPKSDVLYGDDIVDTNTLVSATNAVDSVVGNPDSPGGDSSILFGSDKPGQGISSTNTPVDSSSSDVTDYSALFGSDRPGGSSSSSSTNREESASGDNKGDAVVPEDASDDDDDDDDSSLFGADRPSY